MAGKKFAADFERIDEVKLNDKVLIYDSDSGVVKYATPAQINAKFEDLVADIQTAVDAKQDAEAARDAAIGAKGDAEAARGDAISAKNDAVSAKNDAESASAAASSVLQEALLETEALRKLIDNGGEHKAISYDAENGFKVCGYRTILYGAGVPSNDTIPEQFGIPAFVGQIYINTSAASGGLYYAVGTSAVSDWKNANA